MLPRCKTRSLVVEAFLERIVAVEDYSLFTGVDHAPDSMATLDVNANFQRILESSSLLKGD
jgi:hypothetical protein